MRKYGARLSPLIKNLKFVLFAALGGVVMLAGNVQAADEPLPPEVKALIGGETLPEENPGRISGWVELWGEGVGIVEDLYITVLQKNEVVVLAVKWINRKNRTTTVLDARVIPGKLLRVYLEGGKRKWRKNEMQWYRITKDCSREGANKKETILGMWKFEPNSRCTDPSSLVKKAWLLNLDNGHLTDIPTQGMSCREPDCGDE